MREREHACSLTGLLPQLLEEPLVEDEGHATDLLHLGLCRGVAVHEVSRDGDGQLPAELLALEPCDRTQRRGGCQSQAGLYSNISDGRTLAVLPCSVCTKIRSLTRWIHID